MEWSHKKWIYNWNSQRYYLRNSCLIKNLYYIKIDMLDDISFDWKGIIDEIKLLRPDGKESC